MNDRCLPALPSCWSALTWQQLCRVWEAKLRYGGNPDAARAAALLSLCGLSDCVAGGTDVSTGEAVYVLRGGDGLSWKVTPRELSGLAVQALPWFDYPYGDPGEEVVKDERGKVVKEAREPVRGYVNPNWRDAMQLPEEELSVAVPVNGGGKEDVVFVLPQLACNNLTWEQYRSLQGLVPQLWQEGIGDDERLRLQAQFLAHCLVPEQPEQPAVASSDRFRPRHTFKYDAARAEQSVAFWQQYLSESPMLYHICFQVYQTAVQYYATAYPLLFNGDGGKADPLRDALTGEVGTINGVMKYAGYASQQEVYDSNIPFVLDILNTMTKEAKEIEKMNSRIKKR